MEKDYYAVSSLSNIKWKKKKKVTYLDYPSIKINFNLQSSKKTFKFFVA